MKYLLRASVPAFVLLLAACGGGGPKDLSDAAEAVRDQVRPMNLRRSMFVVVYPECRASDYVSYYFSDFGAAEMPGPDTDEYGVRRVPDGVAVRASEPDPGAGRQIVLSHDDSANELVVEGYTDPAQAPVLERRFKIVKPDLTPDERRMLEAFARGNAEMGMSAGRE